VNRLIIAAKLRPGDEGEISRIFAESDAGPLPVALGVRERSLYSLGDLYLHLVEFTGDAESAMATARDDPAFRDVSRKLQPFVRPYDPRTWRSPADAMARQFYRWPTGT
jgi:cyclase